MFLGPIERPGGRSRGDRSVQRERDHPSRAGADADEEVHPARQRELSAAATAGSLRFVKRKAAQNRDARTRTLFLVFFCFLLFPFVLFCSVACVLTLPCAFYFFLLILMCLFVDFV